MSSITLTQEQLKEARGWLADCEWLDTEFMEAEDRFEFFAEFPDATIERIVDRHFDGGLEAFIEATDTRPRLEVAGDCPRCGQFVPCERHADTGATFNRETI